MIMLVIAAQTESKTLKRKRRFAELMQYWSDAASGVEYAEPEKYVKNAEPYAPYDETNNYEYHGRPPPVVASLMDWDHRVGCKSEETHNCKELWFTVISNPYKI